MEESHLMARRVSTGVALACIATLVAACGTSSNSSSTTSNTSASSTTSKSATSSTSTSSTSTSTTSATLGPCPTRSLAATVGISQGTAGSTYTVIDFTNISQVTCTLYGYPGVALAGGTPVSQIGLAAAESQSSPRQLVTLTPGAVANALLQIANAENYPTSTCQPVSTQYLQIYPPNQTTPIYLSYTATACSQPVQTLTISVVQPGSGSS